MGDLGGAAGEVVGGMRNPVYDGGALAGETVLEGCKGFDVDRNFDVGTCPSTACQALGACAVPGAVVELSQNAGNHESVAGAQMPLTNLTARIIQDTIPDAGDVSQFVCRTWRAT